jgi:hypothetical protein
MNGRHACVAGLALLLCSVVVEPAAAQDAGDKGLTVSAPSSIGLIWHLSPKWAIRPEFSFGFGGSDGEGGTLDISTHSASLAGSALFYMGRWEKLQTYVSPRLSYSWSGSSIESGIDTSSDGWGVSGSFGAQYSLGERFAVFAEAGLGYSSSTSENSLTTMDRTAWTFGTRTQVGATFYF